MTNLLLSPHNDDEALFAAYTLLRHHPKVIVCLNGSRKKRGPLPATRAAESAAAMEILGCEFEQIDVFCDPPEWDEVEDRLRDEDPEHVWAPFPELHGHRHHNRVAELATWLWPGRVSFYSTYTMVADWPVKSTQGEPVAAAPDWPGLKREALGCYQTQIQSPGTAMHFEQPLDEYEVASLRLNLGGGINAIDGYVNLDKSTGWTFESGLRYWQDASVEAITISHALMYVPLEQWPFVFSEMARVLMPAGVIRITEDAIGAPGSRRPVIRPNAKVATTPELVLEHLRDAGLDADLVAEDESGFRDRSLIQRNYGDEPTVFHAETRARVRVAA